MIASHSQANPSCRSTPGNPYSYPKTLLIMYNNVKLLPIGTIEPVASQNDILEISMLYLHNRTWFVQCIHTREHVFTIYTSMFAFNTKLKNFEIFDQNGYLTGFSKISPETCNEIAKIPNLRGNRWNMVKFWEW